MNIILWIAFGLAAGIITHMLQQNTGRENIIITMLLGIAGALVGGILANIMFGINMINFDINSFMVAAVGSVAVLFVARNVRNI